MSSITGTPRSFLLSCLLFVVSVPASVSGQECVDFESYAQPVNFYRFAQSGVISVAFDETGSYTFVAKHGGNALDDSVLVMDMTDLSAPRVMGGLAIPQPADVSERGQDIDIATDGSYAYLANHRVPVSGPFYNLRRIDIADPTHPIVVEEIGLPGTLRDLAVAGGYAYVASQGAGLGVVDIDDPGGMVEVGRILPPNCNATHVWVQGNLAFVENRGLFLDIIDINDPTNPVLITRLAEFSDFAAVQGDYLFIANKSQIRVFDISDPTSPVEVATPLTIGPWSEHLNAGTYGLKLVGDELQVGFGRFFATVDISAPHVPVITTLLEIGFYARGENWLRRDHELLFFDLSDVETWDLGNRSLVPVPPVSSPALTSQAWDMAISGEHAYIIPDPAYSLSCIWVLDLSDKSDISLVTKFDRGFSPDFLAAEGGRLYAASKGGYLEIYDISVPGSPVLSGSYFDYTCSDFNQLLPYGDYVFCRMVLSGEETLCVLDVSDPTTPVLAGSWPFEFDWCLISGDVLVLFDYVQGLTFLNVFDPLEPRVLGSGPVFGEYGWTTVTLGSGYAYCSGGGVGSGIDVVDWRNPSYPIVSGKIDFPSGSWKDVFFHDGYLYLVFNEGFYLLDCGDRDAPSMAGYCQVPSDKVFGHAPGAGIEELAYHDGHLLMLNDFDGGGTIGVLPAPCRDVTSVLEDSVADATKLDVTMKPNPFNPRIQISFDLETAGRVDVDVYDIAGRKVATLVAADTPPGTRSLFWDGRDDAGSAVGSGVYLVRVRYGDSVSETQKITLVR